MCAIAPKGHVSRCCLRPVVSSRVGVDGGVEDVENVTNTRSSPWAWPQPQRAASRRRNGKEERTEEQLAPVEHARARNCSCGGRPSLSRRGEPPDSRLLFEVELGAEQQQSTQRTQRSRSRASKREPSCVCGAMHDETLQAGLQRQRANSGACNCVRGRSRSRRRLPAHTCMNPCRRR